MIKSVIFDIDNTLYNYNIANEKAMRNIFSYGKHRLCLEPEVLKKKIDLAQDLIIKQMGANTSAIHNRLIRFQRLLEMEGKTDLTKALEMCHIYWNTFIDSIVPEQGIHQLVRELRKSGIAVGVGTDMTAYIQYKKLEKCKLLDEISFLVTSEEAGVEKPSPQFFELCVAKAGCRPAECVFIGDNVRKDLQGACENGLYGVWYDPLGRRAENGKPTIYSFKDCLREDRICIGEYEIMRK